MTQASCKLRKTILFKWYERGRWLSDTRDNNELLFAALQMVPRVLFVQDQKCRFTVYQVSVLVLFVATRPPAPKHQSGIKPLATLPINFSSSFCLPVPNSPGERKITVNIRTGSDQKLIVG